MKVKPDIKAEVTFLLEKDGGKTHPAFSGYRADHLIKDNYLTVAEHEYIGRDDAPLGKPTSANIKFIAPEDYPHCLWVGKVITVQEGRKIVGHVKVVEIFNPILDRDADRAM